MPNKFKSEFLEKLTEKLGKLKKLPNSLSLYDFEGSQTRIYIRYSKIHNRSQAFYGIRKEDIAQLEGSNSFICFLTNENTDPIFLPYGDFEETFSSLSPSADGQIKCSIFFQSNGIELYISNTGRFNVEGYIGWDFFLDSVEIDSSKKIPELSHSQVQTILGLIGIEKGYDIWVPPIDRNKLDWRLGHEFQCIRELPQRYSLISKIIKEVDLIWIKRGSADLNSLFEVEHSTPIYSGLLRFNDLHLLEPSLNPKFSIVSNDKRRELFIRQINRPTFMASGLKEHCNFLNYADVYSWHKRLLRSKSA